MTTETIKVPAAAVKSFVGTFATNDGVTVKRVRAVYDTLVANSVGTKGAPSQNAVLKALADSIAETLGADASIRNGWKFANLGEYARVAKALEKASISLTNSGTDVVTTVYAVQNNVRDAFSDFVESLESVPVADRATEAVKRGQAILKAKAEAVAEAKAEAKAKADQRKRNGDNSSGVEGAVSEGITPAALVASIRERVEGQNWTPAKRRAFAEGLVALAAEIEASVPARATVAAPAE